MSTEYTIYCDESDSAGAHYSDFYGGALVRARDSNAVRDALAKKKRELNFHGEVKWQKVTNNYLEKYIELVDHFFNHIAAGRVKVRIMFTQNYFRAQGLGRYHHENRYFLLYYQFIKHAFGLQHSEDSAGGIRLRLYFDRLPDTKEKRELFKDHIVGLNRYRQFRSANITIPRDQVAEVDSHAHDVLQCLDIILGSINFRLNDKHKVKPSGSTRRGKRTVAKEKLYKHINGRIQTVYPRFNIGISTGTGGDVRNRWHHSYRHWLFRPAQAEFDPSAGKKKK